MDSTVTSTNPSDRLFALQNLHAAASARRDEARTQLEKLESDRHAAALAGNQELVTEADNAIAIATGTVAREAKSADALAGEIADAERQVKIASIRIRIDKANAARAAGVKIALERYPKAARAVADLAATLVAIEQFIGETNAQVRALGLEESLTLPPVNAARVRPPKVTPAYTVTEEVPDLSRQPDRVTDSLGGILSTAARMKTVTREVPEEIINYRPPYESIADELKLPPARDGEPAMWQPDGPAHRGAIVKAEALVDAALK